MTRPPSTTPGGKLMDALGVPVLAIGVRLVARIPGLATITSNLYRPDGTSTDYGLRVARELGIGVTLTQSRAGEVCVELDLDADVVAERVAKAVEL